MTLEEARANAHADRLERLPAAAAAPAAPAGPGRVADHRPRGETQHVRVFRDYDLAELRRYIDWQPFFNAWEMKGSFPDILNNPASGPDGAQALRRRAGRCSTGSTAEELADGPRRDRPVPGQQRRRRHPGLPHRGARRARTPCCPCCGSRASTATGVPNRALADFVAPREHGVARLRRRLRRHRRASATEDRIAEFKADARRLQRDPARVAGRPARRGVRRAAARAGPQGAVGLRARRAPRQRSA